MATNDPEKSKAEVSDLVASLEKMKQEIDSMSGADELRKTLKTNAKVKDELSKLSKKS